MLTTETILSRVHAAAEIIKDDHGNLAVFAQLLELEEALEADIREQAARSKGRGSAARTLTAILTAQKKLGSRPWTEYAWLDAAGRQCVCNGFQAFRLNAPLPLEPRPADAPKPIDLVKIFPAPADLASEYRVIKLPDAAEVKAFAAVERAKSGRRKRKTEIMWDFGDGLPGVNVQFLIDLFNVFPDASEVYVKSDYARYISPMYVKAEGGDAVIMPLTNEEKCAAFEAERDAAQAASEEETRRKWEKQEAAKLLRGALDQYAKNVEKDPEFGLSPKAFANMAHWSAICNAA